MNLQNNPFYILKLSCAAGRRDIMTAAEEMGFFFDPAVCAEAQNALINPGKRLEAELDWFPEVNESVLTQIQSAIESQEPIPTDGLISLSRFTATLYNFSISEESNVFEIGYDIIDLDDQFASLDPTMVTDCINRNHATAKIGEVTEQEIQDKLNRKRDSIRKTIGERLSALDENDYVSFITLLAEKCGFQTEHGAGSILFDIIDQYEVRMQAKIEQKTEEVRSAIKQIRESSVDDSFSLQLKIKALIAHVKEWDKLAQPLQLKSQASGMPHQISIDLGYEIRGLALYLHNEKSKTDEALTITEAMKGVFAELGNLSDQFNADADALKEQLKDGKDAPKIWAEITQYQKYAESAEGRSNIDRLLQRITNLNQTIKSSDLSGEGKKKARETLYYISRGVCLKLHNELHLTYSASQLADGLYRIFSDMPSLSYKLTDDRNKLNQQLRVSNAQSYSSRGTSIYGGSNNNGSGGKGCLITIAVFVGIAILIGIISAISNSCNSRSYSSTSKQSSSYSYSTSKTTAKTTATAKATAKPTPTATPKPTPKPSAKQFSQSATVGDPVYATVTSVEPLYTITTSYNGVSLGTVTDVVCKCKTKGGSYIYIWFSVSDYHTYIDSSATFNYIGFSDFETKTYSSGKKLYGKARNADNMCDGLASQTGQKLLMEFDSSVH